MAIDEIEMMRRMARVEARIPSPLDCGAVRLPVSVLLPSLVSGMAVLKVEETKKKRSISRNKRV
jgi:hypothetical protein